MTAILLVGTWVYADSLPGDFLATGTWLCGTRMGFELGMIAEMAMGVAQGLTDDFSRIRIAMAQKEQPWGIRRILPAGRILIWDALRRADDTAELLAMRGYRGGGRSARGSPRRLPRSWPVPVPRPRSFLRVSSVSEFFILTREVLRG